MDMQKKSLLASSVKVALYGTTALMATIASHNVIAQENAADQEDETVELIEVKGIRGALATAAQIKREANTFVDSITASDAIALPDLSVAEALSRVPGVTVTKFDIGADGGDFPSAEGSGNLIRGLGLIRSELNGRDAFTANGGRALDWSSIPPQLIEGVDVYKNQSADLIEGGIGGSINLRTVEPFDRQEGFAVVSIDGTYSDLRGATTPSFAIVAGDRWQTDSGEFGLVGSYSYSELKSLFNGYQSGAILPVPVGSAAGDNFNDVDVEDFSGGIIPTEGQTVGIVNGFQLRQTEVDRERSNIYIAGQWQSNDEAIRVTAKYVRVDNDVFDLERTVEWQDGGLAAEGAVADNYVQVSDVVLSEFSSPGVPRCGSGDPSAQGNPRDFCSQLIAIDGGLFEEGLVSSQFRAWYGAHGAELGNLGIGRSTETTTDDISLNIEWAVDENWFVEFDVHRTTAESTYRSQWIGATTFADFYSRPNIDNPQIEFSLNENFTYNQGNIFDIGNNVVATRAPTSFADPAGYFMGYAADEYSDGDSESTAVKIDATYEFDDSDWFEAVKFGVRRSERDQLYQEAGLNWQNVSQAWNGGIVKYDAFDSIAHDVVDFGDFQRGGVVVGDEQSFVFASADFLRNPDSFYDWYLNEPDITNDRPGSCCAIYSPFDNGSGDIRRDADYREQYVADQISDVGESITNLYVRLDFAHDLDNGMFLDGNFGVRYVKVETDSSGFLAYNAFGADDVEQDDPEVEARDSIRDFFPDVAAFLDSESTDRVTQRDDDYYLPSLNLKLNLTDDMLLRFGASRGITLPNISDLNASQSISAISSVTAPTPEPGEDPEPGFTGAGVSRIIIDGGNPDLEPTIATNLDLALEWYGEGGNSFSFALFHKDIKDIIQSSTNVQVDTLSADGQQIPIFFTGANNQSEATILGFEVSGQYFFDEVFDGIWGNFGIQANYTHLDVDADAPQRSLDALDSDADGEVDSFENLIRIENLNGIIGQSENFANLVGIYQDEKLEVRVAYQYRDEFLNSYETFITGNPNIQDANFSLDASIKYQVNDNIQVSLQGTNLTDELQQSRDILNEQGQTFQRSSFMFDRRFQFGIQYTF